MRVVLSLFTLMRVLVLFGFAVHAVSGSARPTAPGLVDASQSGPVGAAAAARGMRCVSVQPHDSITAQCEVGCPLSSRSGEQRFHHHCSWCKCAACEYCPAEDFGTAKSLQQTRSPATDDNFAVLATKLDVLTLAQTELAAGLAVEAREQDALSVLGVLSLGVAACSLVAVYLTRPRLDPMAASMRVLNEMH